MYYPDSPLCTRLPNLPDLLTNTKLVWSQLQQAAASPVLNDPDGAVLVLADAAHALAHGDALGLLGRVAGDGDADDGLRAQTRDDSVALEARKQIALVDDQPRGRDDGDPEGLGRREVRAGAVSRDRSAVVVLALRDERPAVVG